MNLVRRPALVGAIVGLAFGGGILSLVALRWLGFLGLPPVFFLTLLMVGMPVGGLLLVKVEKLRKKPLASVALLAGASATASAFLFLLVLRWTNAQIDLGQPEIASLLQALFLRFSAAAATFLPLFIGYGVLELAAYRAGLSGLQGNSALVYTLNLSGLLLAFLGYRLLLVHLGTVGLFVVGLALLGTCACLLGPRRWPILGAALLLAGAVFLPGIESWVVSALEVKTGKSTLNYWETWSRKVLHDDWTPHCRLTILEMGQGIYGFYDGMYHWAYPRELAGPRENPGVYRRLHLAFSVLVRPGDRVAVLGSGGGLQVAAALKAGAGRVVAVEVVPQVLEVLSGPLSKSIEGTYVDRRVVLVPQNARRFLEESTEKFDVIVVASVESMLGGMRELFEPSQVMFTQEAFSQMKSHLVPGGILSISKFTFVDRHGVIFIQSFKQLGKLGMLTRGYIDLPPGGQEAASNFDDLMSRGTHYLILAQNGPGPVDALATMDNFLLGTKVDVLRDPPSSTLLPEITDDRAFATGLLMANIGTAAMAQGIGVAAAALLVVGLVLLLILRRNQQDKAHASSFRRLTLASVAVGFNFMLVEYLMVYRWMDRLDVPMDATFLGLVAFAALAAAGSMLTSRRQPAFIMVAAVATATVVLFSNFLWNESNLVAVSIAALFTGSLFPRILRGPDPKLVRVYVWDAYGTIWGGLAALLVPLFFGFSGHQALCAVSLFGAAWAVHRATAVRPDGASA